MSVETRESPRPSGRVRRARRDDGRWTAQAAGRKNRTIFTEEQHSALLAAYDADKYPTTIQKELLARQLGLAPIVVINWFQHRRQREPVKEKGGYVRNNSHSVEGTPMGTSSPLPDGEASSIPSFQEYFTSDPKASTPASGGHPTPSASTNLPLNDTPKTTPPTAEGSTAPAPEASGSKPPGFMPNAILAAKPVPYYGRMQTVRAPNPSEPSLHPDAVPKSANAHIGPMRWELDPLYIAPYIDHGFKDAMLPKNRTDNSSFTLRPSYALLRKGLQPTGPQPTAPQPTESQST